MLNLNNCYKTYLCSVCNLNYDMFTVLCGHGALHVQIYFVLYRKLFLLCLKSKFFLLFFHQMNCVHCIHVWAAYLFNTVLR